MKGPLTTLSSVPSPPLAFPVHALDLPRHPLTHQLWPPKNKSGDFIIVLLGVRSMAWHLSFVLRHTSLNSPGK